MSFGSKLGSSRHPDRELDRQGRVTQGGDAMRIGGLHSLRPMIQLG
jgi:hypothetical protein